MAASERPIIETRRDQMFLVLEPAEIDRLRQFGETRSYSAGERLTTAGEIGPGMFVILTGNVVVTQRDELAHHPPIATFGPGSFLGELAQLSGRPALVDGQAQGRGRSTGHSAAQASGRSGGGGRVGGTHHARADPAPRRSSRNRVRADR